MEAHFVGQAKVEVKWLRNETIGAIAYVVIVMRVETQKEIHTKQTVPALVNGDNVMTELTLPEATATAEGEVISMRVAAKRARFVNRIAEYTIKVAIPTVIKIELGSNLHVDLGLLTLIISSNKLFPSDPAFNVLRIPLTATDEQEQDILSSCFHNRLTMLRLQPSPPKGLFVVRARRIITQAYTLRLWEASEQSRIANLKAIWVTGKTIHVNWENGLLGVQVNSFREILLHSAAGQDASSIVVESR